MRAPDDDPRRIDPPDAVDTFAENIQRRDDFEMDPSLAREAAGREVIADSYYQDHTEWKRLERQREHLLDLKSAAVAKREHGAFVAALEAALREAYDNQRLNLASWLADERYAELEVTVWLSYVANVLAPWERPGDREELVDWIELMYLASAADAGKQRFRTVAAALPEARPAVPATLFTSAAPPVQPLERPQAEPDEQEVTLEDWRGRLEMALDELADLGRAKRSRRSKLPRAEFTEKEVDMDVDDESRTLHLSHRGTPPEEVPWLLSEADLAGRAELRATLDQLNVGPTGTIPEAQSVIETALARTVAALAAQRTQLDVIGFGRGLTIVERPLSQVPRLPEEEEEL
jgi:hypothetical protein